MDSPTFMFKLHPQLKRDTLPVARFPLCQVRLMNDMHYPWLILIPARTHIREIYELSSEDQQQLMKESCLISQALQTGFQADKINIAALGNMVPQLHLHHIARYENDVSWPKPVFGQHPAQAYTDEHLSLMQDQLKTCIQRLAGDLNIRWHLTR